MNGDALLSARRGGVVHFLCSGVAVCGLAAGYNPLQIRFTMVHSRYTSGTHEGSGIQDSRKRCKTNICYKALSTKMHMSTNRFAYWRISCIFELCISTLNRISQNFPANVFHVDDRIYSGGSLAKAYNIIIQCSFKPFSNAIQENNPIYGELLPDTV